MYFLEMRWTPENLPCLISHMILELKISYFFVPSPSIAIGIAPASSSNRLMDYVEGEVQLSNFIIEQHDQFILGWLFSMILV